MENNSIDPVLGGIKAPKEVRPPREPQGTLVIKSQVAEITTETIAKKVHAKADESRAEGGKHLEMIRERLIEISASLNEDMKIRSKNLSFSIDKDTNRMVVTVADKETGKIIKQIPSEAVLKVAHSMAALKGILYDDIY
ncbi:flagellar protein FlaG [Gammaproteobacteria bacterium]|nr:flagellar protein FlaG [Gammaproteobacteria bacterium]